MWIDVNSRLPEIGVKVCAYTEYDRFLPYMYLNDDGEWVSSYFRWSGRTVTHWMPLPAPPTADNVEGVNLQTNNSINYEICPKCKGSGLPELVNENNCTTCKGRGKLS